MGSWSDLLAEPDAQLTPVQDPVPRPAPIPRPGSTMPAPRRAAPSNAGPRQRTPLDDLLGVPAAPEMPPAADPPQPRQRWSDDLGGVVSPTPPPRPAAKAAPLPGAEPDATGAFGWNRLSQMITGKQDARYRNLPAMTDYEVRNAIDRPDKEVTAGLMAATDKELVGVYKDMLGDRFIRSETDANGYPIMVFKGDNGEEQRAYVNKPGLDSNDIWRGFLEVAPNLGAGKVMAGITKNFGLGLRALLQGGGQAAASGAQDATAALSGIADPTERNTFTKMGVAAAGGAAGELVGAGAAALYRRFVTEPRLFNQATGKLTEEGIAAAKAAGLDPADFSKEFAAEFAKQVARTGNARQATTIAANREFGIPRTFGEFTGNEAKLIKEQRIRGGNYGDAAQRIIKDVDQAQVDAVRNAIFGEIRTGNGTKPGIAQQIAPGRTQADYRKDALGSSIRQNTEDALAAAKAKEDFAWSFVPRDITPDDAAMPLLKQRLNSEIGSFPIPESGASRQMARELDAFLSGKAPEKAADWVNYDPKSNIEQFRKRLTALVADAETPTDKKAAGAMYKAFNDWMDDAATQGLLKGATPFEVGKIKIAKGISRDIHQVFDGEPGTAGARIMGQVLKSAKNDSPEGVINALFAGPTTEIKGGTTSALRSLKTAYDTHLPADAAKAAWDDIRLAYFMRLIPQANIDNAIGVQKLQSNLLGAFAKQKSVLDALYTPQEQAMLKRFAYEALRGIEKKNINRSWSGVTAGNVINDTINQIIASFGFKSVIARTAWNATIGKRAAEAYGMAAASKATQQVLPALPLPSYGGLGGGLAAGSNQ